MAETEALAHFAAETTLDDIPAEAREKAKAAIRDYMGVALYGSQQSVADRITRYVEHYEPGEGATVIGRGTASPPGAALANGVFGQAADYDDTFETPVLHPSSPVFPAALAAGELADASGADVLAGYLVGLEAVFRVGDATYPSHYEQGFHTTGSIGPFGAAAAAAAVLDLDVSETRNAFGVAASTSSALKKNFGSMTKPYHAGHAAEMGLRAALLARDGFTADPDILDGPIGYGEAMTPGGDYDPDAITDGLGETWSITALGYKPYPSGALTHAAMEALRTIVTEADLAPDDVTRVVVALDDAADEMLHHRRPADPLQAKFSIEFCLAAVLRERDVGIHEFTDEYVTQPETKAVIEKIERAFEPNLFGEPYLSYGARVTVETTDGHELTGEMRHAPGSPQNQLPEERWVAKYTECAEAVLSPADADRAASAIAEFEAPESLDTLLEIL